MLILLTHLYFTMQIYRTASLHENVINCGIADIFLKVVYNLLFFQLKLF